RIRSMMHIVAMRRTKSQKVNGKPLVELPDRQLFIQPVELSLEERKLYDSMANEGKLLIGNYVRSEALFQNYADVLAILMRLRQLCCHPRLCASALALLSESSKSGTPEELRQRLIASLMAVLATGVDEECPVCLDSLVNPVITHCAHVFCRPCIENVIKTTDHHQGRCPLCRGDIKTNQLVEVPNEVEECGSADGEKWQSSSKVDCLMAKLVELRNKDPTIKSLVISQFTSLLSLIEVPLNAQKFSYVRLDGSMSQARRAEVIDAFNKSNPDSPTVFLLSLKAGGVGLNLTAACRVFLLDPAWNPAAEEQCFDRCHRLGQTRDVIITKFVVKDSVEERMLDLQKKKRELMVEAFKKKTSVEDRRKQRINEIKALIDL
ncbi:helicase-like transcription factor, partial [Actinia tenebrosa]|uniref:Helicase-like transcription factor n=1 Tax=Actinia tenebrosa TaxID=6105 RepID=A0A6P8HLK8_ACTTE